MSQPITLGNWKLNPASGEYESGYDGGAQSGGSSAFAWLAASGLEDGNTIRITSDVHVFSAPEKLAIIGFGQGWLSSASENAPLVDHSVSTITGTENIDYELSGGAVKRFVSTVAGTKYLRALVSGTNGTTANAGFINYDTGSNFDAGDYSFMYSRARITLRPEDAGQQPQFKQDRIGAAANLEGDVYNSCYVKQDAGSGTAATDCYEGSGGARAYYFNGGVLDDGHLTDFGWVWKNNTPDGTDGDQICITAKNGTFVKDRPYNSGAPNYPDRIIQTSSALRPRWMKHQDYIGNTTAIDAEVLRTDIFMQRNGSMFFIADSANPATCTMFCPLVPVQINNSGSWDFQLWKGRLSDYTNASIFMLDEDLNLVAGVNLYGG